MNIEYTHNQNLHTEESASIALPLVFEDWKPKSLLDVGCGTGTWLKASISFGIADVFGVDGVAIPVDELLIPSELFQQQDLTMSWDLGRRFDVAICLEVAEHLHSDYALDLIRTLTHHTDLIIFSAAPPWQSGQHHINCQLPDYWQNIFNQCGFVCFDAVRWRLWNISNIEPWYKQNIFLARRDSNLAGKEERIKPIIHPDLLPFILSDIRWFNPDIETKFRSEFLTQIKNGSMPVAWYFNVLLEAFFKKVSRRFL